MIHFALTLLCRQSEKGATPVRAAPFLEANDRT